MVRGTASFERAAGAALLLGVACAAGWMLTSMWTAAPAVYCVVLGSVAIGLAARFAARHRGARIQAAALLGLVVFLVLGEVLIYRQALLPRLTAMHQAEGAKFPEARAKRELDRMDLSKFLHIEASLSLFAAVGLGVASALLLTRAPQAVVAHSRAPEPSAPSSGFQPFLGPLEGDDADDLFLLPSRIVVVDDRGTAQS